MVVTGFFAQCNDANSLIPVFPTWDRQLFLSARSFVCFMRKRIGALYTVYASGLIYHNEFSRLHNLLGIGTFF